MQPSSFKTYPWSSVLYRSEPETIALNIITILARTRNEWRELSWDEYVIERQKDGGFSGRERPYFDEAQPYTVSEQCARLFSPTWKSI